MSTAPEARHEPRAIRWRVFCPRCLHEHASLAHHGTQNKTTRLTCGSCGRPYQVTTRIDGSGLPVCDARPVFVRAPELLADNNPVPRPR